MLEHGTVYITLNITKENCNTTVPEDKYHIEEYAAPYNWTDVVGYIVDKYKENKFSFVHHVQHGTANAPVHSYYITTNYRVIIENGWQDDLQYITYPTEYHEKRVTVRFTTQIAISREYNRHRVDSIAEQSTRYCNYSKDKYDGQVAVVCPAWIKEIIGEETKELNVNLRAMCQEIYIGEDYDDWNALRYWLFGNLAAEYSYLNMLRLGRTAQEARTVLALDTRTELVHTAFISDWKHFFDLRALGTTGKPHPDAKILAEPLMEEFKRLKLI
jgi:thymidylate synthase (FAD)